MLDASIAAVMHRFARHAGLHAFQVLSRRLQPGTPAPIPGVACRRLTQAELGARPAGDVCVGVFVHGEPAGYAWYAYEDAPHVDGVRVHVPPHAIYRFKVYVLPAHRGRGLASYLFRAADELVAAPGRRRVVTCVAVQNRSSLAASRRGGDLPLGFLGYWKRHERFIAVHSPATRELGLRFYRPAQVSPRTPGRAIA